MGRRSGISPQAISTLPARRRRLRSRTAILRARSCSARLAVGDQRHQDAIDEVSDLVGSLIGSFDRMQSEVLLSAEGKGGSSSPLGHSPRYLVVVLVLDGDVDLFEFGQRYHRTGDGNVRVIVASLAGQHPELGSVQPRDRMNPVFGVGVADGMCAGMNVTTCDIQEHPGNGGGVVVEDFALPVPQRVIRIVFGHRVPSPHICHLSLWTIDIAVGKGNQHPMDETTTKATLADLLRQAIDDRTGAPLRDIQALVEAEEAARPRGMSLNRSTASQILRGAYRGTPSAATVRAIGWLAGVTEQVAFAAAGQPTPGRPLADELPASTDTLNDRERAVVIDVVRALLAQRQNTDAWKATTAEAFDQIVDDLVTVQQTLADVASEKDAAQIINAATNELTNVIARTRRSAEQCAAEHHSE